MKLSESHIPVCPDTCIFIFFDSGGKDSCYNMAQCVIEGHKIVALANLKPADKGGI